MKTTLLFTLLGTLQASNGFNLVYYGDDDCQGEVIGYENNFKVETGTCTHPKLSAFARSVRINDLDEDYDYRSWIYHRPFEKTIRFYDTMSCFHDCRDRHVVAETRWADCVSWGAAVDRGQTVQSFDVILYGKLGFGEGTLDESYCSMLEHGELITFNGRSWRMQQVAATFFNEIPAEEWDDAVHIRNESHRFVQHGDVDLRGKYKYWNSERAYFDRVAIERWNATKHVPYVDSTWRLERYNSVMEYICEDMDPEREDSKLYRLCLEEQRQRVQEQDSGITPDVQKAISHTGLKN